MPSNIHTGNVGHSTHRLEIVINSRRLCVLNRCLHVLFGARFGCFGPTVGGDSWP
jgi:hypothetical protein